MASSCASLKDRHYIKFEETKKIEAGKPIKNLVILGMGKLPTRFFLDKITNRLIYDLEKKGINARYYFLGNDFKSAKKQFDTLLLSNNCDAVMSFFQTDFAEIRQIVDDVSMFTPTVGYIHVKVISLRFNQGFNIRLYDRDNLMKSFWGSALNIDYDYNDPILYQTISKKMLTSLKKNNLCK